MMVRLSAMPRVFLLLGVGLFVVFLSARLRHAFPRKMDKVDEIAAVSKASYVLLAEKEDSMHLRGPQRAALARRKHKQDSLGEAPEERRSSQAARSRRDAEKAIHILFILKAARRTHGGLEEKFKRFSTSLLSRTKSPLTLHAIVDKRSKLFVEKFTKGSNVLVYYYDTAVIEEKAKDHVTAFRKMFSSGPRSNYNDAIFFISPILFRLLPESVERVVVLDIDVEFRGDVADLAAQFDQFKSEQVIGLAREAQPVYRHALYRYRKHHPGTRVGEPPPNGLTGFNSGVMLQDLKRMRESPTCTYVRLVDPSAFNHVLSKYQFKGHLGDQDFYTLLSFDHEELFYVLPCTWNRQLCQFWSRVLNKNEFMKYYRCKGNIHLYHGNCHTAIPQG